MNTLDTHSRRESEDQGCRFRQINRKGIRVIIDLTGKCNLGCCHCFACSEKDELNTDQLLTIIRQLPHVNTRKLILTGGEPLLRMDIEQLIQEATSLSIGVDLNTNMSAFSLKRADSLWNAGLREVSASIDGMHEYHDWFRKYPGDFERTLKGIRLAIAKGYDVDIHGVCTPGNISGIDQIIDLCVNLGVSSYTLLAVVALGNGIAELRGAEFSLQVADKELLWKTLQKKRAEYGEKLPIRTVDIFQYPECDECPMGEQLIGITPTGNLMPCLLAEYAPTDNEKLTKYSLGEAIQHMKQRILTEGKHLACSNTVNNTTGDS